MTHSILQKPLNYAAAWHGADMMARDDWRFRFTANDIAEIEAAMSSLNIDTTDLQQIDRQNFKLPNLAPRLDNILKDIEEGRGFVLAQGLPVTRWGEDYTRQVLWGLGCHLGWAEGQDRDGRLIHDVRDIGQKFGANDTIRYFQTNQAIEFHNDGADIFALLCVRAGRKGGHSQLVSAVQVFNTITERRPDLARVLQEDFHVDARGQHVGGLRCQVIPIFSYLDGHLNVLLKSAYIHSAQRFDDVPGLSDAQHEALEMLDSVMNEPGVSMQFDLVPGDILIASNHSLLHGRTAFDDTEDESESDHDSGSASDSENPDSNAGRHMLRLWLTIPNGHSLPPHYANTREFAATYERRIKNNPIWD